MSDAFQPPRPGAEHALLAPFIGTFRATIRLFFGPGEPQISQGTMRNTWDVDGLYLNQHFTGDPAPPPYPAFVGRGYWGYNFSTRQYEGFWIDNASSIMQSETGAVDASGKVWTMLSEFTHPTTGERIARRSVIELKDHDHHVIESWMTGPNSQELRTMQIEYRRVD
ncbi:MAG: DUF1579 family protein [Planctomycetota bacterium]|jgi:hypothetical protein